MGFLSSIFGGDTKSLNQANAEAKKLYEQSRRDLQKSKGEAYGFYDQALPLWDQMASMGQTGMEQYGQLGPMGSLDAFKNTLDYQLSRDSAKSGLEGLARFANARGMLNSGNLSQDAMDYMNRFDQGVLANARGALNPYFGLGQNAATAQTGIYGGKANAALGTGTNLANIGMQQGQNAMQHGANLYTADQTGINNMWNFILGLGKLGTSAYSSYKGA